MNGNGFVMDGHSDQASGKPLTGRYWIDLLSDDELAQGWVLREENAGLYLVETFVRIEGQTQKVLRVVHPVEMKGWVFFENREQAIQYCDQKLIETLPDIDVMSILRGARQEFEDMALEQLAKAREMGQDTRVEELQRLLRGNSRES